MEGRKDGRATACLFPEAKAGPAARVRPSSWGCCGRQRKRALHRLRRPRCPEGLRVPPARTTRKAHARLVLLLSYYRPRVHVAFICTAAEATQARSRLGIGWRGVGRRGIWAVTQAGKQEHELLPLQDGSEDSCRQAELGELSVCLRCRRHALILPMRRRSLQGCSKAPLATGCDRGQAAEAA
jgi:hypothetical protein